MEVHAGPITGNLGTIDATLPTGTTATVDEVAPDVFDVSNSPESTDSVTVGGLTLAPGDIATGLTDEDGDGLVTEADPCPPNPDCDGDAWKDGQEAFITTNPLNACTPGGWPPDPAPVSGGDGIVQINDVFFAASRFGQGTGDPLYTPRVEIASQDGVIGIDDVFAFASRFGQTCV